MNGDDAGEEDAAKRSGRQGRRDACDRSEPGAAGDGAPAVGSGAAGPQSGAENSGRHPDEPQPDGLLGAPAQDGATQPDPPARAPQVFLAYPQRHVALAAAVSDALLGAGYRVSPGPLVEASPIEAWTTPGGASAEDAAARAAAAAVVIVWSEDAALDPALRFEADTALARIALAAVLAPRRAQPRIPERFRAKMLPRDAGVAAVVAAVAAHLTASRPAERKASDEAELERLSALEERVRRLSELGLREEAIEARRAVIDLRRSALDAAGTGRRAPVLARKLAAAVIDLADRLADLGQDRDAAQAALSAVALLRRLRDEHGVAADIALARALTIAAQSRARLRRWSAAAASLDEAVAIYRRLHRAHPALARPRLALLLGRLAEARLGENRRLAAETAAMESLAHFRTLARSGEATDLENLAEALERLSEIQAMLSRPAAAVAAAGEAVELYREAGAGEEDLAPALLRHARTLLALKRVEEALGQLSEATTLARTLVELDPDEYRPLLGAALGEIAAALLRVGREAEAAEFAAEGVQALGPEFDIRERGLSPRRWFGAPDAAADDGAHALRRRLDRVLHARRRRAWRLGALLGLLTLALALAGSFWSVLAALG